MSSYIALYRASKSGPAKLVAVGGDPKLVGIVASALLRAGEESGDQAIDALERGRRGALRAILREAQAKERFDVIAGEGDH